MIKNDEFFGGIEYEYVWSRDSTVKFCRIRSESN